MGCRRCKSEKRRIFTGEIAIQFPEPAGLKKNHRVGLSRAGNLSELWNCGVRGSDRPTQHLAATGNVETKLTPPSYSGSNHFSLG
jgi:hypothetical protein